MPNICSGQNVIWKAFIQSVAAFTDAHTHSIVHSTNTRAFTRFINLIIIHSSNELSANILETLCLNTKIYPASRIHEYPYARYARRDEQNSIPAHYDEAPPPCIHRRIHLYHSTKQCLWIVCHLSLIGSSPSGIGQAPFSQLYVVGGGPASDYIENDVHHARWTVIKEINLTSEHQKFHVAWNVDIHYGN